MILFSEKNNEKKVDSLPEFPRNAVQSGTEAGLTAEFEWDRVGPGPYDRPRRKHDGCFIKLAQNGSLTAAAGYAMRQG